MQRLDFIVMALFASFILVIGLAFARTGTDTKSFFAAGASAPWWVSGLSLFMSFLSAGTFVVWGSIAYNQGFVAITIQLTMCVGGLVTAGLVAPRWKRTGALTAAEYVGNRLGTKVQQFFTGIFLVVALVTVAQVLYPVGKLVYLVTPFSLETCIVVLGLMVIVYTAVGGLWAVMVTDVLQFVILFAAVLIVLPISLDYVGGFGNFIAKAPDNFFTPTGGEYTLGFILAFTLYHIVYIGGNWAFVQRYTSVQTERDSRKVAYLFAALYAFSPFIWMLPPMIYRVMNPQLSGLDAEGAYLMICRQILPAGLLGLMLAAMISATASTANTLLNLLAAVFTNDVYKKRFRPGASEKHAVAVGRSATVAFGLMTIGLALLVPKAGGLVNVVLGVGAITGGSLLAPVLWTLFSRRQTSLSVFTTAATGLLVSGCFKFIAPVLFGLSLSRAAEMILGIGIPLLVLALFEWVIYAGTQESAEYRNFRQLGGQGRQGEGTESPAAAASAAAQNTFAIRAIAVGVLVTGLGIGVLGLAAASNRGLVAGTGAVIALLALPAWRLARPQSVATPKVKKGALTAFLVFLLALPAPAQYTIRQPNAIPLHGTWHFTLDPAAVGEPEGWYRSDFPVTRWDQVPVPHCFSVDGRYLFYTGTAWYRRTFPWQPAAGKRVLLHFDAAYYGCRVWLNDRQAGTHEGGYTPFSFDVTDLLKAGENTLAVSVDNNTWKRGTIPGAKDEYREADAPGGQFPGWMNYGGLIRPVYLTVEPEVYVDNVKVEAEPDLVKGTARLRLKTRIRNASGQPVSPRPAFGVEGNGKTVSAHWQVRAVTVPAGGTAVLEAETVLKAGDVKLWSLDEPNLYQLRVTLPGDTLTTPFGIRKVEVRNAQLLLNGKPVKAAGGNRVVDYPGLGSLEPDWLVEKDLRLMKEAGMEFSRLTHYTPSETVLDWADRHGMLIITEAGNWQLTPKQMDNDTIRARFREQFREMAERDWNHPSVIAYSVGNEYLSEQPAGQRWTKDMIAYGRGLDATRLFTFASMRLNTMPKTPADEASQYVDFVSTNTYGNHAAVLKKIHELYPGKPILVSEYGRRADDPEGEAGQVSYLAQFLSDIRAMPYVIGAAWWSFNDYQSRYPGTHPNGYRPWGLVGPERNQRPLYGAHRREMAPVTLRKVSWQPGGDGRHGLRVRITARNDFPSYAIRGYHLKAGPVRLPIPDLQPGQSTELTIPVRGFAQTLAVEVYKPTGFAILHQLIHLTNDPRKSNR